MLSFIEHIFGKKDPKDVQGFKKLRKDSHSEVDFLEKYFEHYKEKVEFLNNLQQLWDTGKTKEIQKAISSIMKGLEGDVSGTNIVRYITTSLSEVKEEYSMVQGAVKDHAQDIAESEKNLIELEKKEYQNLTNFLNLFEQRLKPNLEKQKSILGIKNIQAELSELDKLKQLIREEWSLIQQLKLYLNDLTQEIVDSIKILEIPVDVRIPGSANALSGFKNASGTYLEKKSGGDKYPGKGVLIEQRSEYGGVLFSRLLGLKAPEIQLEPMKKEEMDYINAHDFVSDKENLSKLIFSKRMTVKYVSGTKPLFDVRGDVEDVMRHVDPGYLFAFPPQSQKDMIILFFLDVLISNYDRHGKNIMIDPGYHIIPIDPAMGFNTVDFKARGFEGAYGYKFDKDITSQHWKSLLFNTFTRYIMCVETQKDLEWIYELISSKLSNSTIKAIVDRMYSIRPEIKFLPNEMGLYSHNNKDMSPSEMASILIARKKEILHIIKKWDSFSQQIGVFDDMFTDYMKRGRAFGEQYIPKHCSFRDHALIRKVFYDNKKPISREQAIKEYYEEQKKKHSSQETVQDIITDYSTAHETPCALETKLRADYEQALRSKDKAKRKLLSVILNDIQYAEIQSRDDQIKMIDFRKRLEMLKTIKVKLNDAQIITLIQKRVKENDNMILEARKGNRKDMVKKCETENSTLYEYLPRQLSDNEIQSVIEDFIQKNPGVKNPGQVIGMIMKKYKGKIDGKKVNMMVNNYFLSKAA